MSAGEKSLLARIEWTSLIVYLCAYIASLIGVTMIGWALYHAKPKQAAQESISYCSYFTLYKEKSWMILSIFIHIITQAFNFSVMLFLIDLALSNWKKQQHELMAMAVISLLSFSLYRFASAILIWRLSHSIRKSLFQIIDITILYQLLKGYKKKTRNNPSRIVQYINYLNAMFQSWSQATVQLIFLITQPLKSHNSFMYILIFAIMLNLYCVIRAVYEKDMLLTSDGYRKKKTVQQILTHVLFRFVDISLRIIILSMLWITITFTGLLFIICIEFFIIAYLAFYTKQMHRLQELIAVILHISFVHNKEVDVEDDEYGNKSRPVTPATLRMTNELQVSLNVDMEEVQRKEEERKRQRMSECQCFKWRIAANIVYILLFVLVAEANNIPFVFGGDLLGIVLTVYCMVAAVLYPFIYYLFKNSKRWNRNARNSVGENEYDIFAYLQRNDFESAKEIIDFGKKMENEEYVEWANNVDFSADNNPILLLQFLCQQSVKITNIVNKSQGGLNILHQICKNPELQNVGTNIKFLIKLGFDTRMATEKTGDTPLHIACSHCNKSVMLSLLNNGTGSDQLFVKNKLKQTPLHSLMVGYNEKYEQNQISMATLLFETYNAQNIVSEVDIYGKSPLHIACKNKLCPTQIIRLLLENGAYSSEACNDDFYPRDHVEEWEESERKSDKNMVLKWLTYGLNEETAPLKSPKSASLNANPGSSYIELSEDTRTVDVNSPIATPKVADKEEEDEEEEAAIYTDDEDEKEDVLTPMDPNPDHDAVFDKTDANGVSINDNIV